MPGPWVTAAKVAAPIVGGVLGGKGGKKQAQAANQPTFTKYQNTSQLQPYGGAQGQNYLNALLGLAGQDYARDINIGPGQGTTQLYNAILGRAMAGANQQGGGGIPQLPAGGGGGGGVGGGGPAFANRIANFQVTPTDYQQKVLSGYYLDEGNPYTQELLANIRRESAEGYREGVVPQIDAAAVRAGRYGSGAYAQAQALANEEYNEALQNTIAQVLFQNYGQERGFQQGISGDLSQENIAGRGNLTSIEQQRIAAAAAIRQAMIAAATQRAIANAQLAQQGDAQRFAQLAQAFGIGQSYDEQVARQALLPTARLQDLYGLALPILQGFGTQTSQGTQTTQGPQYSPSGAGIQGALGGVLAPLSIMGSLGLMGTARPTGPLGGKGG